MGDVQLMRYASVGEALDAARTPRSDAPGLLYYEAAIKWRGRGEFLGLAPSATVTEAMATVERGWPAGATQLSNALGAFEVPRPASLRRRSVWTDQGDEVDMQRVYAGNLDTAWRRTRPSSVPATRRVRIITDVMCHAGVPAKEAFWKGAAAAKLGDALSDAGYAVEMVSASACGKSTVHGMIAVVTKAYDQPFDLPALAATSAFPGFFRGALFLIGWGQLEHVDLGESWGWCLYLRDGANLATLKAMLDVVDDAPTTFLADSLIRNVEDAKAWVARSLAALGVEAAA